MQTHAEPTLPARPHSAGRRSGRSRNTHTSGTNPAGQTALGRSPVREEPQHTHTHAGPTLPARPHSAGHRSGRSRNTHTHMRDQPCRPDEGCPVLPRLVPGQLGTSLDTWDTPVSHTQEVLSIPVYPGQSWVVPPDVESHGSRGTKYPGIPRTVPGSPTMHTVPWY